MDRDSAAGALFECVENIARNQVAKQAHSDDMFEIRLKRAESQLVPLKSKVDNIDLRSDKTRKNLDALTKEVDALNREFKKHRNSSGAKLETIARNTKKEDDGVNANLRVLSVATVVIALILALVGYKTLENSRAIQQVIAVEGSP